MITDNGSNFIKMFNTYGKSVDAHELIGDPEIELDLYVEVCQTFISICDIICAKVA